MWNVTEAGDVLDPQLQIKCNDFHCGIIHLNSSYTQFVPSSSLHWGTSFTLLPVFHFKSVSGEKKRSGGGVIQQYHYGVLGGQLIIQLNGKTQYEHLQGCVRMMIKPPLNHQIEIEVLVVLTGTVKHLDASFPWEPFGAVYLSSMFFNDKTYNCAKARTGTTKDVPIPAGGMIFAPAQKGNQLTLLGGDPSHRTFVDDKIMPLDLASCVQNVAPAVDIHCSRFFRPSP